MGLLFCVVGQLFAKFVPPAAPPPLWQDSGRYGAWNCLDCVLCCGTVTCKFCDCSDPAPSVVGQCLLWCLKLTCLCCGVVAKLLASFVAASSLLCDATVDSGCPVLTLTPLSWFESLSHLSGNRSEGRMEG